MSETTGPAPNHRASRAIFVAATDTGVGKTMVSALLLDFLRRKGVKAGYQKWVATGCEGPLPEDLAAVLACAEGHLPGGEQPGSQARGDLLTCDGRRDSPGEGDCCAAGVGPRPSDTISAAPSALDLSVPYRFRLPASPHLAAEAEGGQVDPRRLQTLFRQALAGYEVLLVEGVGGLLVPLNRRTLLVDLVAELSLPVLLVARSGLGTINHTLLSLETLRRRAIPVVGVVCSDEDEELPERIVTDNLRTIAELGQVAVLGRLPRCRDLAAAREAFIPIGEALFSLTAAPGGVRLKQVER